MRQVVVRLDADPGGRVLRPLQALDQVQQREAALGHQLDQDAAPLGRLGQEAARHLAVAQLLDQLLQNSIS